jgi:hypothetical protein
MTDYKKELATLEWDMINIKNPKIRQLKLQRMDELRIMIKGQK